MWRFPLVAFCSSPVVARRLVTRAEATSTAARIGDRFCDTSPLNGYCTKEDCGPTSCPSEAVCIRFFTPVADKRLPHRPANQSRSRKPIARHVDDRCVCDQTDETNNCVSNLGHCAPELDRASLVPAQLLDRQRLPRRLRMPLAPARSAPSRCPTFSNGIGTPAKFCAPKAARTLTPRMRGSFLRRRLLSSLTAILGVSVLVFLLVHLIPGDPVDNLLGERADPIDKVADARAAWISISRWPCSSGASSATSPTARSATPAPISTPHRRVADRRGAALDDRAGGRGHGRRAHPRAAARHPRGAAPRTRARRGRDRRFRSRASPCPRCGSARCCSPSSTYGLRWLPGPADDRAGLAGAGAAGVHARHPPDGDAGAHDPLVAARGARRGLRAHRAREGAVADRASCSATRCATRCCR